MADHADPIEIIDEIEALTVHCRPPLMPVEQRSRWQQDWVNDLKGFPIEAIRQAFRQWRQSESTKFPTPGQILPMIERAAGSKERSEAVPAWRYEIADDEYRALSLRDKVRHHKIAAHHCRTKAGPMPHRGPPVERDAMPEDWQAWQRRAENHDAEAIRLKQSIGQMDQRA